MLVFIFSNRCSTLTLNGRQSSIQCLFVFQTIFFVDISGTFHHTRLKHYNRFHSIISAVFTLLWPPHEGSNEQRQGDLSLTSSKKQRLWLDLPAGPGCQTAPRTRRQRQRPPPGRQQSPGNRSNPPWSLWWRPCAWCRWPTVWYGHMSDTHIHAKSISYHKPCI